MKKLITRFNSLYIKVWLFILVSFILVFNACTNNDNPSVSPNAVYFEAPQGGNVTTVTIDTTGSSIPLSIRTAKPVNSEVKITIDINEEALINYNLVNGTNYKLLPESYYSFSDYNFLIEKNNYNSELQIVNIKSIKELPDENNYLIPITISQVNGDIPLLDSAKDYLIIVKKVLYTSVPYLHPSASETSNSIISVFKTPMNDFSAFTLEWRCNFETYTAPYDDGYWNQSGIYAGTIYTRITNGTIQLKDKGTTYVLPVKFQGNKWYHFAIIYDGVNYMFYVDGELTLSVPTAHTFSFGSIGFGNDLGGSKMINEIRFWSVARTKNQLINNQYVVSPDSKGLEGYWKCNEGNGSIMKDYSKNGNDMFPKKNDTPDETLPIKWIHNVRMPALD